jgi:hypothetical protein
MENCADQVNECYRDFSPTTSTESGPTRSTVEAKHRGSEAVYSQTTQLGNSRSAAILDLLISSDVRLDLLLDAGLFFAGGGEKSVGELQPVSVPIAVRIRRFLANWHGPGVHDGAMVVWPFHAADEWLNQNARKSRKCSIQYIPYRRLREPTSEKRAADSQTLRLPPSPAPSSVRCETPFRLDSHFNL